MNLGRFNGMVMSLDFDKIEHSLNKIIEQKPELHSGIELIMSELTNFELKKVDLKGIIAGSFSEFQSLLRSIFNKDLLPSTISALNLGVFESNEGTRYYISGSSEWACNNDYFPEERYIDLLIQDKIDELSEENYEAYIFLALSIAALYMIEFFRNNKDQFINSYRPTLSIATGFDDGDIYNIGKVIAEGVIST